MSRVLLVALDEAKVIAACLDEKVGVSAIERLGDCGVRLVCMSSDGTEKMRGKLKRHLIHGEVKREPHRPATPLW